MVRQDPGRLVCRPDQLAAERVSRTRLFDITVCPSDGVESYARGKVKQRIGSTGLENQNQIKSRTGNRTGNKLGTESQKHHEKRLNTMVVNH